MNLSVGLVAKQTVFLPVELILTVDGIGVIVSFVNTTNCEGPPFLAGLAALSFIIVYMVVLSLQTPLIQLQG